VHQHPRRVNAVGLRHSFPGSLAHLYHLPRGRSRDVRPEALDAQRAPFVPSGEPGTNETSVRAHKTAKLRDLAPSSSPHGDRSERLREASVAYLHAAMARKAARRGCRQKHFVAFEGLP
jgi:hypothetical protein